MHYSRPISIAITVGVTLLVLGLSAERLFSDARVQQAFLAGTFLANGWIATFVFREVGDGMRRRQRSRDIQEAFKAEIYDYSEALADADPEGTADEIRKKVLKGGDAAKSRYHPLVPRISPPVVFDALASEISLLPEVVIDDVVQFYSVLSDLSVFAEDLMSESFVRAKADARATALADYIDMRATAHRLSLKSYDALVSTLRATRPMRNPIAKALGVVRHDDT